ncbi:hypothetical protein PRIPAC_80670, partial [Pristionchus pacificus]
FPVMTEEFKVVPKLRPLDIMRGRFDLMKSELSTTMTMCKTKFNQSQRMTFGISEVLYNCIESVEHKKQFKPSALIHATIDMLDEYTPGSTIEEQVLLRFARVFMLFVDSLPGFCKYAKQREMDMIRQQRAYQDMLIANEKKKKEAQMRERVPRNRPSDAPNIIPNPPTLPPANKVVPRVVTTQMVGHESVAVRKYKVVGTNRATMRPQDDPDVDTILPSKRSRPAQPAIHPANANPSPGLSSPPKLAMEEKQEGSERTTTSKDNSPIKEEDYDFADDFTVPGTSQPVATPADKTSTMANGQQNTAKNPQDGQKEIKEEEPDYDDKSWANAHANTSTNPPEKTSTKSNDGSRNPQASPDDWVMEDEIKGEIKEEEPIADTIRFTRSGSLLFEDDPSTSFNSQQKSAAMNGPRPYLSSSIPTNRTPLPINQLKTMPAAFRTTPLSNASWQPQPANRTTGNYTLKLPPSALAKPKGSSCPHCIIYLNPSRVNNHIRNLHKEHWIGTKLKCPEADCDFRSSDVVEISDHRNNMHRNDYYDALKASQKFSFPNGGAQCPFCKHFVTDFASFINHMEVFHPRICTYEFSLLRCLDCCFTACHFYQMVEHWMTKQSCKKGCKFQYETAAQLLQHDVELQQKEIQKLQSNKRFRPC